MSLRKLKLLIYLTILQYARHTSVLALTNSKLFFG